MQVSAGPRYKPLLSCWLPLIVYCGAIFVQSAQPSLPALPDLFGLDKLLHFTGYAFLGILFVRAFRSRPLAGHTELLLMLSIAAASLYGLSDEVHQYFVPGRCADGFDFLADVAGSISGVLFYYLWIRKKERR